MQAEDEDTMMEEEENDDFPTRRLQFSPMSTKKERPPPIIAQENAETKESISVFLRLKPLANPNGVPCIQQLSNATVAIRPPQDSLFVRSGADQTTSDKYHFSAVFDENKTQEEVYRTAAEPLVRSLLAGQNGLLFSYGPTNAGKTYTIQGVPENEGILPRVLRAVLAEADLKNSQSNESDNDEEVVTYEVWATYLEIYNEFIYDLLGAPANAQTGRTALKIKEEAGNIIVKGLKEVKIRSLSDAQSVLRYGQTNRQVAETMVNQDSSRSHSIFNLRLEKTVRSISTSGTQVDTISSSKLSVVDLAGSERSSRTQNTGLRLKEASNINVSLMNLGRCLEALRWNQQHPTAHPHMVPFRQSKLTRIFQDWFIIRSRMVMLVNVSPEECDFEEMLQALRYGAIAKEIAISTRVNRNNIVRVASAIKKAPTTRPVTVPVTASAVKQQQQQQQLNGDDWSDDMEELSAQIRLLETQLYETESRCAQIENTVREEVTNEMMEQIKEMQDSFNARLETERISTEEKFQKKLDIIVREALRRHNVQHQHVEVEGRETAVQLEYYKRRVDELQKEIKTVLARTLAAANANNSNNNSNNTSSNGSTSAPVVPTTSETTPEMQSRLDYLEAEVAALQKQIETSASQLAAKTRSLSEVRSVNEQYESALTQAAGELKLMTEQNDRLREEVSASHLRLQHREAELVSAKHAIAASDALSAVQKDLERALKQRDEAVEDKARLQEQMNEITLQFSKVSSDAASFQKEREELKAAVQHSREKEAAIVEKNTALAHRVEELTALLEFNSKHRQQQQQQQQLQDSTMSEMADTNSASSDSEDDESSEPPSATKMDEGKRDSFVVIGSDKSKKKGLLSRCKALVSRRKEDTENIGPTNTTEVTKLKQQEQPEKLNKKKRLYNLATPSGLDVDAALAPLDGSAPVSQQQPIARRLRSRNSSTNGA